MVTPIQLSPLHSHPLLTASSKTAQLRRFIHYSFALGWWPKHSSKRLQACSQNCKKLLLASSCPSVRPSVRMEQLGFHWTDFHEISYWSIFSNICWKYFKFHQNVTRITSTLHKDQHTFLITSRSLVRRMKNVPDKHCREKSEHNYYGQ